jgi:predicted transcriptional regulator YdeE
MYSGDLAIGRQFTSSVNINVLYSPYCVVDDLATCWVCYQIQGDDPVPEGMTVFNLPEHRYAKAK